jgi:hypothetical protein
MRASLWSRVQAGGGASAADLGRVVLRRRLHPSDRAGQTAAGAPVAATALGAGGVAGAMLPHGTARGGHQSRSRRVIWQLVPALGKE